MRLCCFIFLSLDTLVRVSECLQEALSHVEIQLFLDIQVQVCAIVLPSRVIHLNVEHFYDGLPAALNGIEVARTRAQVGAALHLISCHTELVKKLRYGDAENRQVVTHVVINHDEL